ncbi:3-dehydroquinate synthase, partial [Candidatus Pelagibacter sp.]|nr:3-dehydroquinate synthase [Candidatus Pelagibacter sp.]
VILGIICASKFSLQNNLLSINEFRLIKNHLIKFNLPINLKKHFSKKNLNALIEFIKKDKKNQSEKISLVLLKKIGSPVFNIKKYILFLKQN